MWREGGRGRPHHQGGGKGAPSLEEGTASTRVSHLTCSFPICTIVCALRCVYLCLFRLALVGEALAPLLAGPVPCELFTSASLPPPCPLPCTLLQGWRVHLLNGPPIAPPPPFLPPPGVARTSTPRPSRCLLWRQRKRLYGCRHGKEASL